MRVSTCLLLTLGLLLGLSGPGLAARELPFTRDHPLSGPQACPDVAEPLAPSPEARAQSAELASMGEQAVILGDLTRAEAFLHRAVELDPLSADLAYRRARVLEDLTDHAAAMEEYCRALALAPDGQIRDARSRLDRLADGGRAAVPDEATISLEAGLVESLAMWGGPSPGLTLTLGVLVPGMGHLYAGRPLGGLTLMALAGGAVAAGLLIEEVHVRCLTAVEGGQSCPHDQVVSRTRERPHLMLAVGAAAAVGVAGALEAFLDARAHRAPSAQREARGPRIEGPTLASRAGRIELALFAVRFR